MQVARADLDEEEPTWEQVNEMFKDVPKFLVRKLKQMRLPKRVKNALRRRYGMQSECPMFEVDFIAISTFMDLSWTYWNMGPRN